MAKKKLEGEKLLKFRELVMEGKTPEEIKDYFGIGVSSVHNYKRKLRDEGLDIPDVRGKRPSDVAPVAGVRPLFKNGESPAKSGDLEFIVNGVKITVHGSAKTVDIDGNSIRVEV